MCIRDSVWTDRRGLNHLQTPCRKTALGCRKITLARPLAGSYMWTQVRESTCRSTSASEREHLDLFSAVRHALGQTGYTRLAWRTESGVPTMPLPRISTRIGGIAGSMLVLLTGLLWVACAPVIQQGANDCVITSYDYKNSFSGSITVIKKYDASLQLEARSVRQYQEVQNDFGIKYEAICRDWNAHRIGTQEYNCRRSAAERALDKQRTLKQLLDNLQSDKDASSAREAVSQSVAAVTKELQQASAQECVPLGLKVTPDTLLLSDPGYTGTLYVRNIGPDPLNWWPHAPQGFYHSRPAGGMLASNETSNVEVVASLSVHPGAEYRFAFTDNRSEKQEVVIEVQRAPETRASSIVFPQLLVATGDVALRVANKIADSIAPKASGTTKRVIATRLLLEYDKGEEVRIALRALADSNPVVRHTSWYSAFSDTTARLLVTASLSGSTALGYVESSRDVVTVSGREIGSAILSLKDVNSGAVLSRAVDPKGRFTFANLRPGAYVGSVTFVTTSGDSSNLTLISLSALSKSGEYTQRLEAVSYTHLTLPTICSV